MARIYACTNNQDKLYYVTFCKLVNWSTLGMPGYVHQKRWYQVVGSCDFYLRAKSQI